MWRLRVRAASIINILAHVLGKYFTVHAMLLLCDLFDNIRVDYTFQW